jgi:hypothetical protein
MRLQRLRRLLRILAEVFEQHPLAPQKCAKRSPGKELRQVSSEDHPIKHRKCSQNVVPVYTQKWFHHGLSVSEWLAFEPAGSSSDAHCGVTLAFIFSHRTGHLLVLVAARGRAMLMAGQLPRAMWIFWW